MKLRAGIAIPIWQRPELTRLTVAWNKKVFEKAGCEVVCVLTGSEGDESRQVAIDTESEYIEVPNVPLGAKVNAGVWALRDYAPDFVVSIGSDNLLSRKYAELVLEKLDDNYNVVSNKSCYFHDAGGDYVYWAKGVTGVGAVVDYAHLKKLHWKLFDSECLQGLDAGFKQIAWHTAKNWFVLRSCEDAPIIDIKTGVGIHDMRDVRKIRPLVKKTPARAFFHKHFRGFPLDKITVTTEQ